MLKSDRVELPADQAYASAPVATASEVAPTYRQGDRTGKPPEHGDHPAEESLTVMTLLQQDQPRTLPACKLRGHVGELCRQHTHGGFTARRNPLSVQPAPVGLSDCSTTAAVFFGITFRTGKMTPDSGHLLVKSGRIQ